MSIDIYSDGEALAAAAAQRIANLVRSTDRVLTIGLAGGSTPEATYRKLAESDIDWRRVVMWLGDERWVPHDHQDSNTRMARSALVDPVVGTLLAPDTAFGDPRDAAAHYADTLADALGNRRPDLVLLGIGNDGHTASLFPGTEALEATDGIYLANWVPQLDVWRLTASMPLLWSASELVFLVNGSGKAGILSRILDDEQPFPAQRVAAGARKAHWMLDEAAAAELRSVPR